MNKTDIKNFAVWARAQLIDAVTQRAYEYDVTEQGENKSGLAVVGGRPLSRSDAMQRNHLLAQVRQNGFHPVMEEAAYTWFNRFVAIRFMEANGYLSTRVFTDENGAFKPELLREAMRVELDGLDRARVIELLETRSDEALYKYLLITQCNALNRPLPGMFEKIADWTELLFPANLLRPDSVAGRMIAEIPEEDWRDQVQIIGWLYQYYNTEPKQAVFDGLKNNVKITREKIPAATQLFTPDWIVRYMVENSLGRLWLESHPDSPLRANWKYYLDEAEQEPEVAERLRALRAEHAVTSPEEIRVIDPCMGSGHILVYAFDVFVQIYTSEGYSERDAAKLILEKNLYGLEIDRRAHQLAYFALMMKARQYHRRILTQNVFPQVYEPTGYDEGMEYGSLVRVDKLEPMPEEPEELTLFTENYETKLNAWNFRRLLAQKYDVVVTNPPYMGNKGLNSKLSEYLQTNYTDYKSDTFAAFMIRCGEMAKQNGFVGMFSPYVWMFIQSYEKLRSNLYNTKNITTLIQFEYSAFEEATVPVCSLVYRNSRTGETGGYFRLVDFRGGMEVQRQKYLEAIENSNCGFFYNASAYNFTKIPGSPVAYWLSQKVFEAYMHNKTFGSIAFPKVGMQTSNNDKYLRLWFEVDYSEFKGSSFGLKWIKYLKGGSFRKWYGNLEYLLFYNNSPAYITQQPNARVLDENFLQKIKCTWTDLTSGINSFRLAPSDTFYDISGHCFFPTNENKYWLLGYANSAIFQMLKNVFNSTFHCQVGDVAKISLPQLNIEQKEIVSKIVKGNVEISRTDWDIFETSWDFKKHPLV